MAESEEKPTLIYVGIGSSAGGLEAIRELVNALRTGNRLTFFIAQHLSPSHTSMLVDLIRRECLLDVSDAEDGLQPEPNNIYITPPNRDIEIRDGLVKLSEARTGPMPKPNINRFFHSLAENLGAQTIGIILSGTGTDGAAGMIEIKSAGGITMAQDPKSAKYDGMPMAAIHADAADLIQTPAEIAETLLNLDQNKLTGADLVTTANDDVYAVIIDLVLRETGINLVHYKKNSIQRRIRRRMSLCNRFTMDAYLELLRDNPKEIHDLARDAFIGVTGFFRDPEAFHALGEQIALYLKRPGAPEELRIWVPGCATGEEAYTVALLFEEHQRKTGQHIEYRIFATDIGTEPLGIARLGHYSVDAVGAVNPQVLGRYFKETANGYAVNRRVRDHVVFSTHDMIRDAPFSKLDLVSCRNVMIYFDNELQRQVFDTFHYSLKPSGLLMLGMSESNTQAEKLFTPAAAQFRIYQKVDVPGHRARLPHLLPGNSQQPISRPTDSVQPPLEAVEERLNRLLSKRFAPASAVVNQHNEIMFSYGDLSSLMTVRAGPASLDILTLVHDSVRSTLRALLYKVRREAALSADTYEQVIIPVKDTNTQRIIVIPFDPNRPGWVMISFQSIARPPQGDADDISPEESEEDKQLMMALEHELFSTRESLQTVVEELETTNEELQAANEELQSSNEEFQSTNEELQTTNEELQSSNEELLTLNDELQEKTREYEKLTNQLQNIQNSIDTPLIVVNNDLRVTRFVPKVDELIPLKNLRLQDHIIALPWRFEVQGLRDTLLGVIDSHQAHRSIVRLGEQVWQMHISPFIDASNRAAGAVLVFSDATELYASQERFRQEKERAQITLESIGDGVVRVTIDNMVEYLNPVASAILGWSTEDALDQKLENLFVASAKNNESIDKIVRNLLADSNQQHCEGDYTLHGKSGKELHISYSIGITTDRSGNANGAVIAFRDMTDQHETISRMSWMSSHDDLTGAVNRREMEKRLATSLNAVQQGRKREAVFLYLDLDQFKVVNDTCGHLAGDEMLKNVTRILRQHTRHRDTLARLGGDEFGILLEGCLLAEAEMVAEKIRGAIEDFRFRWKDKIFRLGISIGIVALTPDSGHITDVMSNADAACYAAKLRGRNRIQIHTPDDEELAQQRADLHWVAEITDAMDHDRLRLYMQEIKTFDDTVATHWEVLLRMFNHKGKLLLPGSFLPAAERYGLIQKLDEWVINHLFATLHQYRPAGNGESHPCVNVNLSGASFTDARIADHVHDCLEQYDIDPTKVVFEITETAAISNLETAKNFITRIKKLGCKIALDDFGSGMSSLNYLKVLEVDYLKIDGSFIHDIETNPLSRTIVKAIIEIANQLDIKTVAEFATSQGIIDQLCELGICCVQGQGVCDPVPMESFLDRT